MTMKNKNTFFWICGLFLAAAAGVFVSSALLCHEPPPPPGLSEWQKSDRPPEKKDWNFKRRMDSALGLSARQIALLDSNGRACDSIRREIKAKIHAKERRLKDILEADSVNDADLQLVRMELLILNEKRLDSRIADIRFFKSVLTAEQKNKLKEMSRERSGQARFPTKQ